MVASRVGGLPEVIRHGIDGYLAEVGNLEEMANYSQQILRNQVLRRKLGCEARKRVLGKFTPQRIVPQYESLYQRTLAK
ncbi:N-acetyl-alpha-D-glucosaminyl L-malate synthase [subsurface metagenome]